MKLKKLFKDLKELRKSRKEYKIKWRLKFVVDDRYYLMCLLPTIIFYPWVYRTPGEGFIYIQWFNMILVIGEWTYVGGKNEEDGYDESKGV